MVLLESTGGMSGKKSEVVIGLEEDALVEQLRLGKLIPPKSNRGRARRDLILHDTVL
jgi:hypothetical protein